MAQTEQSIYDARKIIEPQMYLRDSQELINTGFSYCFTVKAMVAVKFLPSASSLDPKHIQKFNKL